MAVYVAEPVTINEVECLVQTFWDSKNCCEIPIPLFATTDIVRFDPSEQWGCTAYRGFVNVQLGEQKEVQSGYAAEAVDQTLPITFDIYTLREGTVCGGIGRQYMHDIKQEIRRIAWANKHSLTNWQRIIYNGFEEMYEDSNTQRFHGRMNWTLCNAGINTPTEEIDNDLFTRSNAAIGVEWTDVAGTWCVVSNKARLSTCTANAVTRFIGSCCETWSTSVRVTVDVTTVCCIDAGIAFRWTDACNYWKATLERASCVNYVRLSHITSGSETQFGEVRQGTGITEPSWTTGDVKMLEVEIYQNNILVNLDGQTAIQLTSTLDATATNYGLFSNSCTSVRFDCFRLNYAGGSGR